MSALHFGGFSFKLMMKRILNLKALSLKKPKSRNIVKNKGSGISTD